MQRVVVVGNSGSGKTTLAAGLARVLGVPHVELDAINHQRNWTPLPHEEFRRRVAAAAEPGGAWVIDGNYAAVRELLWDRADTVVWLDLPRRVVLRQIVGRSVSRALRGTELWNGNRENVRMLLALHDPQKSVIAWSIVKHREYRRRYGPMPADPRWAHVQFVRLRSRSDVQLWLSRVDGHSGGLSAKSADRC